LAALKALDDPLAAAFTLALHAETREQRAEFAIQLLDFDAPLTADSMSLAAKLAKQLRSESPEAAARIASANAGPAAAKWLQACVLEQSAAAEEALACVESIYLDGTSHEARAIRLLMKARLLETANRLPEAWTALAHAADATESYTGALAVDRELRGRFRKHGAPPARRRCRIALAGSITLDFWAPVMRACCFAAGIDAEIYVGGYQQYRQELLDPASGLYAFKPDIIVLAVDWRALSLPDRSGAPRETVREIAADFEALWRIARERCSATVIQHNFEIPEYDAYGRLSASLEGGRGGVLRALNLELAAAEARGSGVVVFDLEQAASIYGKSRWTDPVLWHAAKQYPAPDASVFLMHRQAALFRAVLGLSSKCIVLDLDNTLWGGIIGEDGLNGIRLGGDAEGEAYAAFHRYLKSLAGRGILLAVCSKNNPADARSVFQQHPETVLRLDDFSEFAANWQPKDANLREIAKALNLGIDSLVFIDDNPVERELIRKSIREIYVPEMPVEPALFVRAIERRFPFEAIALTEEDAQRTELYRENAQRREFEAAASNIDEFLAGLDMRVELRPFDEPNLARITQLINKTNQFNLTTRRRGAAEVSGLLARPDCYTQFMRLRDRFGDNGITGILIAFEEEDGVRIDTWLLSCRVLGRRVEDAMIASVIEFARARGLHRITGEFIPTAKNAQVRGIYDRFGFRLLQEDAQGNRQYERASEPPIDVPGWLAVDDRTGASTEITWIKRQSSNV